MSTAHDDLSTKALLRIQENGNSFEKAENLAAELCEYLKSEYGLKFIINNPCVRTNFDAAFISNPLNSFENDEEDIICALLALELVEDHGTEFIIPDKALLDGVLAILRATNSIEFYTSEENKPDSEA